MTNSQRFIVAYNKIDSCLRNLYNISSNISFSELIRRCADRNYIVRSNETLLQDYARLRNAIVHKSTQEIIIAEPHDSVVDKIEQITELICTPPRAVTIFGGRKVTTISADAMLKDAIKLIRESHYSNIPVYKNNILKGIINNKILISKIGEQLARKASIDAYIDSTATGSILDENYFDTYYRICGKNTTIENIAEFFYTNRKLIAVLITESGAKNQKPMCIITTYDLTKINAILDGYQNNF